MEIERTTREVEGRLIVTSGSLVCPSPDLCDQRVDETREQYVARHCENHRLGAFASPQDAERNLALWCFYFFHKHIWGNPELASRPHWEIHAFVAESVWSETDLMSRIPLAKRKNKTYLPPADQRRAGEYRRFKQIEVPRQCQKSSIGSRAYVVFRSLHEYFVNDKVNFRILLRSAVAPLMRQALRVIRRMSTKSAKLKALFGIWMFSCERCGHSAQLQARVPSCPNMVYKKDGLAPCGATTGLSQRHVSLVNPAQGSGSAGTDELSFRWLTDGADADAVAAYNVYATGLETENTGQRPDLYVWDDPQTEKNSKTVEMRANIRAKFESSWRELQFGGEMLVFNTRKYVSDFGASIQHEPLASEFHALRREVRWRTDEPDDPPYVEDGWRYYYPVKGNGQRALDAKEVRALKKQKNFSGEYMNDPLDEEAATFKRSDFIIVSRSDDRAQWPEWQKAPLPVEIVAGLNGAPVTHAQQLQMDRVGARINAMNSFDPADNKNAGADENFGVGVRLDRAGRVHVTCLAAGRWSAKKRWSEVDRLATYNGARFTDYEMGIEEEDIQASCQKWERDRSEQLTEAFGAPTTVRLAIKWSRMPKSAKYQRIEEMEAFLPIYILDDAGSDELIEKYIAQWVGLRVEDHDDGPDATARLIQQFSRHRSPTPQEQDSDEHPDPIFTLASLKKMAAGSAPVGLWGAQGGSGGQSVGS